jgi:dimethylargininase
MTRLDGATVIVREVSPALASCALTYRAREPIDVELARAQHHGYAEALRRLGARVVALPAEPDLPDAVFVEDTAVVVDEVAVTTIPGSESRRMEVPSVADALARYRPVEFMVGPGTVDGGDVMRVGRTLYVGVSTRTSTEGACELRRRLAPYGYSVVEVDVGGSLHLKTACSFVGRGTVLANRNWFDAGRLDGLRVLDVEPTEPWAANTVRYGETVLASASAPVTCARLAAHGYAVLPVDISELQKAEAGLSCLSLILDAPRA